MFKADVMTNFSRLGSFWNKRFIHKFVRSYLHAVEIQTERQKTTGTLLKIMYRIQMYCTKQSAFFWHKQNSILNKQFKVAALIILLHSGTDFVVFPLGLKDKTEYLSCFSHSDVNNESALWVLFVIWHTLFNFECDSFGMVCVLIVNYNIL